MKLDAASSIVVGLSGGLGNQLFQYAMGRALSLRSGIPLVLDLAWFDQVKGRNDGTTTIRSYALAPFELKAATQCVGLHQTQELGFIGRVFRRLGRHLPRRQMGKRVRFERGFAFDPSALQERAPVWLEGYWQSHKYFDDCAGILRQELGRPRAASTPTLEMLEKISRCDAICLHIRRGDYVSNKHAAATHGICDLDYYAAGMDVVSAGLQNPHCFVFSDEPEWARSNLSFPSVPITIVDINGADSAHEDLWLMSACKRFVIANSSLSWWGAWLSGREEKVVVAPRQWFADVSKDTGDLIPTEWVRL